MACEICGGVGFEIVLKDDREFAKTCVCRADGIKGPGILERLRVPKVYRGCTLANFNPASSPALRSAWEKAASFAAGYPHTGVSAGLGLLFSGPKSGIGKTHLAVAVLRELAETKKARGQFWDFHELMREIRSSYNPDVRMTETEVLDPIINAEILVLDDLGAWKMTDWMNDTLFYILNQRYVHQRPSIITTNFEDKGLDAIRKSDRAEDDARDYDRKRFGVASPQRSHVDSSTYTSEEETLMGREYLVERIGNRLRSRLMEMCVVVRMNGADHREARQHYNQSGALDGPTPPR
jgi:DNA replication protein DnaC